MLIDNLGTLMSIKPTGHIGIMAGALSRQVAYL
jgi:hypothetical protein